MFLWKRPTKMMTKMKIRYIYVVCLISSLDLIEKCQCAQSANSQTSEKPNDTVREQSRKLSEDIESITSYTNLISDSDHPVIIGDHITKEFQYYNEPIEITTAKFQPSPSIDVPSNHRPVHQVNLPFYPQVDSVPYVPNIPNDAYVANPPVSSTENHLVKIIREPFWAPEVYKLENQYISTFRSIKTSVMGLYYKMQNFVSYVMSLFSLGKLFGTYLNYYLAKLQLGLWVPISFSWMPNTSCVSADSISLAE